MITRFRIENFKALRDITLDLTPLHVLIGPNDSGKTTILEAIAALCRSVDHPLRVSFLGRWKGAELVWRQDTMLPVKFSVDLNQPTSPLHYELCIRFKDERNPVTRFEIVGVHRTDENDRGDTLVRRAENPDLTQSIRDALSGVQIHRWVPEHLALPVAQSDQAPFRLESTGFGLARCLDDILGHDRALYGHLENEFRRFFPEFSSIKLRREPGYEASPDQWGELNLRQSPGKGMYFEHTKTGIDLPASQVSDGVLLVLGYLTLLHLPKPPRVILIEEPENGIYPTLLGLVLEILKELVAKQTSTQIVLTTHSPYVLDLFKPEEVTLCRKNTEGAVQTFPLSRSKPVKEQIDVFSLGEIWSAEGEQGLAQPDEAPSR